MKFSVSLKAFIFLFIIFFDGIFIVQSITTERLRERLRKDKTLTDEIKTFWTNMKSDSCFNKKDYGLGIGLEAKFTIDKPITKEFKVPFEIKLEWDTKGNFKANFKYPFQESGGFISKAWAKHKAKKAGYNELIDEDPKKTATKTAIIEAIKNKLPDIVSAASKALLKWVSKKALKAVIAVFVPFLAPLVLIYDIYKIVKDLSIYSKKNEEKSTALNHEITTYFLKYTFANLPNVSASGYLALDVNKQCIETLWTKFKNFFKTKFTAIKGLWSQLRAKILKKDSDYMKLVEELPEDPIPEKIDEQTNSQEKEGDKNNKNKPGEKTEEKKNDEETANKILNKVETFIVGDKEALDTSTKLTDDDLYEPSSNPAEDLTSELANDILGSADQK